MGRGRVKHRVINILPFKSYLSVLLHTYTYICISTCMYVCMYILIVYITILVFKKR